MNPSRILLTFVGILVPVSIRSQEMSQKDIEKWVGEQVATNRVVVFSGSTCPYCHKAIDILTKLAPNDITVCDLDNNPNRPQIMEYFGANTGAATVPRVFIGGKFYGDCSKVTSTNNSGELKKVLLRAGCQVADHED